MLDKSIRIKIEEQLKSGLTKGEIFNELKSSRCSSDDLARYIANTPMSSEREKYVILNNTLFSLVLGYALLRTLTLYSIFKDVRGIRLLLLAMLSPVFLIPVAIAIWLSIEIKKFNRDSYLGVIIFGIIGLSSSIGSSSNLFSVGYIVTAMLLAAYLKRKLLPNNGFIKGAKKDAQGNYIF